MKQENNGRVDSSRMYSCYRINKIFLLAIAYLLKLIYSAAQSSTELRVATKMISLLATVIFVHPNLTCFYSFQILNLTQALKDEKSPIQLVQMPRVIVERSSTGSQGRIVHLSNAFTQTFHSRKPFFSSWQQQKYMGRVSVS